MPAQSKQQQKFMGIVHAIQKGDIPASDASPEAQKVAQDMKPSDVKDFAATSHKGLPRKVKQEILKKLKEYAMTLPGHHAKSAAPMDSLRSDDEMDLQNETRIPQNFNVGTTRDYHTKLATTPREDYDDANFRKDNSGQPDLKEGDDKLEMLKLFNKALRMMPGSPKQKEIIKQLNVIRTRNGLKPLDEKQVVNKIAEYASKMDLSYIQNKDAKVDGTPEDKDAIDKKIESIKEALTYPKRTNPSDLAKTALSFYDFYTDYIDDAGRRRSIMKRNDDVVEWFGAHPKEIKEKAYKIMLSQYKGDASKIERTFGKHLKESVNELKLNDLVGNQYKYVIGSSEEKYIGKNDKKYVLQMIEKSLKTYLYDEDFALNYLDGSQRREYNTFFEKEVLTPMLKKVDFTLNNFFTLDKDKVKWKLSSSDTRKMVDEIFRKNSKVPSDIKKEYYVYRLEYAGVKLKESINESDLKGYLVADVVDDIIKSIGTRFVSGQIKNGGNKNKVYLKLTDKKFGSGVIKILKSRFGIEAKYDTTFGNMPSVSFWGDKVVSESVNEELSFDEKQMVIGIIEILKQVEDPKNRMKITLNMLKKFKDEGIVFDYQKFVDALKEYSMGSYEYDKGNRELGEAMIKSMKSVVTKLLPTNTLARHANDPNKNKEFVDKIVRELGSLLNRFYKQNDINVVLQ